MSVVDSSKVTKKNNNPKEQPNEQTTKEPVKSSDKVTISDKVREYSEHHMEATNTLDSEITKGLTDTKKQSLRNFAGGFKSKFLNYLIKEGLEQWSKEEGTIPSIDRARFPVNDGSYHRAFRINEKNKLTYTIQDARGHEITYLTTDSSADKDKQATEEYINELFEEKQNLAQNDLEQKAQQRKQKKEDKERERMRMI